MWLSLFEYSALGAVVIIAAAYAIDLLFGDPRSSLHPVRWMGLLILALERALRHVGGSALVERLCGAVLTLIVVSVVYGLSILILYIAQSISPLLFVIISIYMAWSALSAKTLAGEARAVVESLGSEGIERARERLSFIVGRDTASLSGEEVTRAVVETVSENTSDGIVAPLFFLAIGGPPLALAYKAVNTLDSMLGYKSSRYRYFGSFPARLDDLCNLVPARITALLMVAGSFVLGFDWRSAIKTVLRDGGSHPSPNAGLPEAAVAGAVGVRLGGSSTYSGKVSSKPHIGEERKACGAWAVGGAIRIMHASGIFMAAAAVLVQML